MTKKLFVSVIALILCGCDLGGKKTPPEGATSSTASFQVKAVTAEMVTGSVHAVFQTPTTRLFNFTACVTDNIYRRDIANQRFSIWSDGASVASVVSDEDGCIHWQERIELNFFADSRYQLVPRGIRGEGSARGEETVPLAINPWLHDEPSLPVVFDLRFNQPKDHDAMVTSFMSDASARLWTEAIDLQNIREAQSGQLIFNAQLRLRTTFRTRNSSGSEVHVSIPAGKYDADVRLYVQQAGGEILPVGHTEVKGAAARNGELSAEISLALGTIPSTGVYRVGLKLTPVDGPKGLRAFEGSFDLGPVEGFVWSGNTRATLASETLANPEAYSLSFLPDSAPAGQQSQSAYYVTNELRCLFDGIEKENSITRLIKYRVSACLKRRDNQRPRQGVPIEVVKNDQSIYMTETNDQGCVDFEDTLSHRYFEPECRHKGTFRIRNADLGLDEEVPLQINPWESGLATFCRDARILEPKEKAELNNRAQCVSGKPRSEYFIDTFDASEQKVDYAVDNSLNLEVIKTFRFGLNPKVRRASSQTQGRNMVEPLRPGLYLVRWALLRNGYEDPDKAYQFIDGGEAIARVAGGRFTHDFPVRFRDRRLIDSRNRIMFEFNTIDESRVEEVSPDEFRVKGGGALSSVVVDGGLAPKIFDAPIELRATTFVSMFPFNPARLDGTAPALLNEYAPWISDSSVSAIHSKFPLQIKDLSELIAIGRELERLEAQRNAAIKSAFAESQDLTVVTPEAPVSEALTYERLHSALANKSVDDGLYRELCDHWTKKMIPETYRELSGSDFGRGFIHELRGKCITERSDFFASVDFFRFLGARYNPFLTFQEVYVAEQARALEMLPPGRNFQIAITEQFTLASRFSVYGEVGWRAPLSKIPGVSILGDLGFAFQIFSQWRQDQGNDIAFRTTSTMNTEENLLRIELSKYRRCVIVRMNSSYAGDHRMEWALKRAPENVRGQIAAAWTHKGFLVCGEPETNPVAVNERYYYISQTRAYGTQQDPTDIRNRYYSVGLRSERDFHVFMNAGRGSLLHPDVNDSSYNGYGKWTASMDGLFGGLTSAHPGVYLNEVFF